jgi:hypothetical protein|tara:strand:- start:4498 stop:5193 length:696 start_codon:yes stop_codon:yes gene_type:complete
MFKCHKCNKIYKREKPFIRHEGSCQQKPKNTRPSLDQMWYIILKQQKQLAQQKEDIEKLKKIVNKDVKTIDMNDWLNTNVSRNINYSTWIKRHISITASNMKYIMRNTFSDSISVLLKHIQSMDKEIIPIFCFNHVKKTIYIYENQWIKATADHIKMLLDEINLQLLRHNIEYEKTLDENTLCSIKHLENNEKLFIIHSKKKESIKNKLKLEIINLLKIDLNDLNKYKFSI